MGGSDVDCHGLLIAWDKPPDGQLLKRNDVKMADCSFVANKSGFVLPDDKTIAKLGLPAPVKVSLPAAPKPPAKVTATLYKTDAVRIVLTEASENQMASAWTTHRRRQMARNRLSTSASAERSREPAGMGRFHCTATQVVDLPSRCHRIR